MGKVLQFDRSDRPTEIPPEVETIEAEAQPDLMLSEDTISQIRGMFTTDELKALGDELDELLKDDELPIGE